MHVIKVGDCEYCEETGELKMGQEVDHLQPQVAKVFVCLAQRVDEVVSRDELMDKAWHHQVISDECLTRCISVIRKTLKRHNSELKVETLHKRGYRMSCQSQADFHVALDKTHVVIWACLISMLLMAAVL